MCILKWKKFFLIHEAVLKVWFIVTNSEIVIRNIYQEWGEDFLFPEWAYF